MKKFFVLLISLMLTMFCMDSYAFVVETIFFKPTDADVVSDAKISGLVKDAQELYASEMDLQGFGRKTFNVEKDLNGDVKVHRVNGRHESRHYSNNAWQKILPELPNRFNPTTAPWDKQDNIRLIIVGGVVVFDGRAWGYGWPRHSTRYGGSLLVAANSGHLNVSVIAHEIGHCFGLYHKPEGSDPDPPSLEHYEARWLDKHYHFNNRANNFTFPKIDTGRPKMTALQENKVKFELGVSSNHGLHQAMIFRKSDIRVIDWDYLNGENRDTITLHADRHEWANEMVLEVMDELGNYTMKDVFVSLPESEKVERENKNPDLNFDKEVEENPDKEVEENPDKEVEEKIVDSEPRTASPRGKIATTWASLKMR